MSNTVKIQPIEPKERPILFSTEMVQAILEGRKTQTRRVVKPQPTPSEHKENTWNYSTGKKGFGINVSSDDLRTTFFGIKGFCPYGKVGDLLWVRETWSPEPGLKLLQYKANLSETGLHVFYGSGYTWKPSIHMPKEAARIWLKVKEVRVERLHEITEEAAIAEGAKHDRCFGLGKIGGSHREGFINLWMDINGEESWSTNPWVWVIEFEVVSTTGRP